MTNSSWSFLFIGSGPVACPVDTSSETGFYPGCSCKYRCVHRSIKSTKHSNGIVCLSINVIKKNSPSFMRNME